MLDMRIITLEEHYRSGLLDEAIRPEEDFFHAMNAAGGEFVERMAKLGDLGKQRIADMDAAGIDVQVISHTVPSPEIVDAARGVPLATKVNDEMAEAVKQHPNRLAAFCDTSHRRSSGSGPRSRECLLFECRRSGTGDCKCVWGEQLRK